MSGYRLWLRGGSDVCVSCLAELCFECYKALILGLCRLNVEHKLHRAVVASEYLVVYARLLDMAVEAL